MQKYSSTSKNNAVFIMSFETDRSLERLVVAGYVNSVCSDFRRELETDLKDKVDFVVSVPWNDNALTTVLKNKQGRNNNLLFASNEKDLIIVSANEKAVMKSYNEVVDCRVSVTIDDGVQYWYDSEGAFKSVRDAEQWFWNNFNKNIKS